MKNHIKIAVVGGDMRATIAAMRLADGIYDVFAWGIPRVNDTERIYFCDNIIDAISDASAVILPLPSSLDGVTLNCKTEDDEKIKLVEITDAMPFGSVLIGGRIPKTFFEHSVANGIRSFDYFDSESFQIKNAYTTAEAALSIAMNNLSKNIRDASFVVTGYGRIARQLVRLLNSMGARITVAARKESDCTLAELEGCTTVKISEIEEVKKLETGYDVIFNTVPHTLFDSEFLEAVDGKTLFIELASSPGGIDVSAAKHLRSNVLWASSLPGKYAPESAGELIADCVERILDAEVI